MNIQDKEGFPRPDFIRENWTDLNGIWKFLFDDEDRGERERWFEKPLEDSLSIKVPFCYQSKASGVKEYGVHETLWYERTFPVCGQQEKQHYLLHFGAVDYETKVWLNGSLAGSHTGGNCAFTIDMTDYIITEEENHLTVKVVDKMDCVQPRGKQFWGGKGERIWYMPTSGIWKNVWLECTSDLYIEKLLVTPDIDCRNAVAEVHLNRFDFKKETLLNLTVSHEGKTAKKMMVSLSDRISRVTIDIAEEDYADEIQYWTPENPYLYDIDVQLTEEAIEKDKVFSYFGMRKISIKGNKILLNNKPYYQKLILDQGYWPDTLMTPPNKEAYRLDIMLIKKMGFNGARKHQKIEDAGFYYWADRLGLLVWGEMPSSYQFNTAEIENVTKEWMEFLTEAYNHPCIIAWVPLNESWGVRNIISDKNQQSFAKMLYHMTKAFDAGRLVSNNDGWEQVSESDICGIHDYTASGNAFQDNYEDIEQVLRYASEHRMIFAQESTYSEKPILITEFGGIAFESDNQENWGYYGAVKTEEEFLTRFEEIVKAIKSSKKINGYCYTQLTDVFQEVNGLLTSERKCKVGIERIRAINEL